MLSQVRKEFILKSRQSSQSRRCGCTSKPFSTYFGNLEVSYTLDYKSNIFEFLALEHWILGAESATFLLIADQIDQTV